MQNKFMKKGWCGWGCKSQCSALSEGSGYA